MTDNHDNVAADYDAEAQEARLRELVTRLLAEARRQGADSAEVSASIDVGLSVNVRRGELETVEHTAERGFGITVYQHTPEGQRKGSASTSDDRDAAIIDTVRAACNIARFTQPDPCNGLADADLMARHLPDLDLLHHWLPPVDEATDMAQRCEAAALSHDERISNSDGASLNAHTASRCYGNSHGFLHATSGSRQSVSAMVIAADNDGMQRDYWYSMARRVTDLDAPEAIGRRAAERAVARLGARPLATGRYPVMLAPNLAVGFIGTVLSALSGGSLYRKASFLQDSLGKAVLSPHVTLREQPLLPRGMGSSAYDGDGVATREQAFIAQGIVQRYLLGSYSARRLGLETTGNSGGVHNLRVEARTLPLNLLLGEMNRGLLVTEMMGQGINMLTGDYSRGASCFWVENGEIQYPVEEITIAGNLQNMLQQIVAFGDDVDQRGNIWSGSLLLEQMTVAGA